MFLGIDIGTSKVAAVIVGGRKRVEASASLPGAGLLPARPGQAEQDAEALLETASRTVRELPADLRRRVRAVGLTGQMHGVVLLDSRGRPVSPFIPWHDQRAETDSHFLAQLNAKTGHRLHAGYGSVTLAWLQSRGVLPKKAAAACGIHDLMAARLCGLVRPDVDVTGAAGWGLFDLGARNWDLAAVRAAGVPRRLLPEVRECGAPAGAVTARVSSELGIPAGIPVALAIGDNQASLLATLTDPERELGLTLGTGGQLSAVVSADRLPEFAGLATCECRPYTGGRIVVAAAILSGGAAWEWMARTVAALLRDFGAPAVPMEAIYERMDDLGLVAEEALDVTPCFRGERHAPRQRGAIAGITLTNFTAGNLAHGLAFGLMRGLREMLPASLFASRRRVSASGNALRRSRLLRAAAETVFGLPLILSECREEAATGAALNAAPLA